MQFVCSFFFAVNKGNPRIRLHLSRDWYDNQIPPRLIAGNFGQIMKLKTLQSRRGLFQ
jgi:hypothetical protein